MRNLIFPCIIRLDRQNDLILNSVRTVAETEEVGIEITKELERNREKILSSRARVSLKRLIVSLYYRSCSCRLRNSVESLNLLVD